MIPLLDTGHADFILAGAEPCSEGDVPALIVPLTRECKDRLYDKLVTAFSGQANRYDLASTALEVLGIEPPATKRRDAA